LFLKLLKRGVMIDGKEKSSFKEKEKTINFLFFQILP